MVQKRRRIGQDEIVAALKRYGVGAKSIGLKG
jgi:hypothetical protein